MSFRPIHTLLALTAAATTLLAQPAAAQDFPSKPITLVVPFGPGSGTDQMARLYAKALGDEAKVSVVVDNKGGASGFIAAQHVEEKRIHIRTAFREGRGRHLGGNAMGRSCFSHLLHCTRAAIVPKDRAPYVI